VRTLFPTVRGLSLNGTNDWTDRRGRHHHDLSVEARPIQELAAGNATEQRVARLRHDFDSLSLNWDLRSICGNANGLGENGKCLVKWKNASSIVLSGFVLASSLLAQVRPCSDLSRDNPTLYRPDGGSMHCLDWDQATCSYVERPCHPGELGFLCYYIPATCSLVGKFSRTVAAPATRRKTTLSITGR
jgi:hypothetical protein